MPTQGSPFPYCIQRDVGCFRERKIHIWFSENVQLLLIFWGRIFHWTWSSPAWLDWLAKQLPASLSAWFCTYCTAGITDTPQHLALNVGVVGKPISSPRPCVASTLSTEPSLQCRFQGLNIRNRESVFVGQLKGTIWDLEIHECSLVSVEEIA